MNRRTVRVETFVLEHPSGPSTFIFLVINPPRTIEQVYDTVLTANPIPYQGITISGILQNKTKNNTGRKVRK
jgi:hypothetical protein